MSKTYSISDLASRVKGVLKGKPNQIITGVCPLDEPRDGCISFIYDKSDLSRKKILEDSKIDSFVVKDDLPPSTFNQEKNFILVRDPVAAISVIAELFTPDFYPASGVHKHSDIHASAKIGKAVSIAAFCSIGADVVIEDNVVLFPNVVIYREAHIRAGVVIHAGAVVREKCVIGPHVTIQPGAVIGADGFGYAPDKDSDGKIFLRKIPQVGVVDIQANVEIGANACIDRGTLGTTRIGAGTKIDNLVQIGHNTKVGSNAVVCGLTGVGGSTNIGDGVVLGGHVGVADHLTIAAGSRIAGKSGVTRDIEEKGDYAGYPIRSAQTWRREFSALKRLPEIIRDLARQKR